MLGSLLGNLSILGGLMAIAGVSLRDVPVIRRSLTKIRLPYSWRVYLSAQETGFSKIARQAPSPQVHRRSERLLYALHGEYKQLGIASSSVRLLGYPQQFAHDPYLNGRDYDLDGLLSIMRTYLDPDPLIDVDKFFKLWSPYVHGTFDSRIVEIIQMAALVTLGYDIPASHKKPLVKFIRDFFLSEYIDAGKKNRKYLEDMQEALESLVAPEKSALFSVEQTRIASMYNSEELLSSFLKFCTYVQDLVESTEVSL